MVLIAYCTGLIIVCTVMLVVITVLTLKNYWLLRDLLAGGSPGAHERPSEGSRPIEPGYRRITRYDSNDRAGGAGEWTTGPVTPYTPDARKPEERR